MHSRCTQYTLIYLPRDDKMTYSALQNFHPSSLKSAILYYFRNTIGVDIFGPGMGYGELFRFLIRSEIIHAIVYAGGDNCSKNLNLGLQ